MRSPDLLRIDEDDKEATSRSRTFQPGLFRESVFTRIGSISMQSRISNPARSAPRSRPPPPVKTEMRSFVKRNADLTLCRALEVELDMNDGIYGLSSTRIELEPDEIRVLSTGCSNR